MELLTLTTNTRSDAIREFYAKAGFDPSPELRIQLVREELAEVREAFANFMKELGDLQYVVLPVIEDGIDLPEDLDKQLEKFTMDLIIDLPMWMIVESFARVHESNMSKTIDPVRDETGKLLKGPHYKAPDFSDLA